MAVTIVALLSPALFNPLITATIQLLSFTMLILLYPGSTGVQKQKSRQTTPAVEKQSTKLG
ncbi:hypothetical protein [Shewanella sp. GXUN23E]|uniref:hypothetical protein n=1 Tax=Shewanella sp. GXUN23E TaxID=3422498 RepID=UPI003D7EDD9A